MDLGLPLTYTPEQAAASYSGAAQGGEEDVAPYVFKPLYESLDEYGLEALLAELEGVEMPSEPEEEGEEEEQGGEEEEKAGERTLSPRAQAHGRRRQRPEDGEAHALRGPRAPGKGRGGRAKAGGEEWEDEEDEEVEQEEDVEVEVVEQPAAAPNAKKRPGARGQRKATGPPPASPPPPPAAPLDPPPPKGHKRVGELPLCGSVNDGMDGVPRAWREGGWSDALLWSVWCDVRCEAGPRGRCYSCRQRQRARGRGDGE
jgi:hypothetical protein